MPAYFADYDTRVTFITEKNYWKNTLPCPMAVLKSGGITGKGTKQCIEFSLKLEDNPEFTSSVLLAYARAVYRLNKEGQTGAKTVFDIPLGYLSPKS